MNAIEIPRAGYFDPTATRQFEMPAARRLKIPSVLHPNDAKPTSPVSHGPSRDGNADVRQSSNAQVQQHRKAVAPIEQHESTFDPGQHGREAWPTRHTKIAYAARIAGALIALAAYAWFAFPRPVLFALGKGLLEATGLLALPATVGLAFGCIAVKRLMRQTTLPERMMSAYSNPHIRTSGSRETP